MLSAICCTWVLNAAFAVLSWLPRSPFTVGAAVAIASRSELIFCSAVLALSTESVDSGRPFSVSTCAWMSELASQAWLLALSAADWPPPQPADASSASATTPITPIFMPLPPSVRPSIGADARKGRIASGGGRGRLDADVVVDLRHARLHPGHLIGAHPRGQLGLAELREGLPGLPDVDDHEAVVGGTDHVRNRRVGAAVAGVRFHLAGYGVVVTGGTAVELDQHQRRGLLATALDVVVHGHDARLRLRQSRLGDRGTQPLVEEALQILCRLPYVGNHEAGVGDGRRVADQPRGRVLRGQPTEQPIDTIVLLGRRALEVHDHQNRHICPPPGWGLGPRPYHPHVDGACGR